VLQTKIANYYWTPPADPDNASAADAAKTRIPADRARHIPDELEMDNALAASFPASDPPSWNAGMARPHALAREVAPPLHNEGRDRGHGQAFVQAMVSVGALVGLVVAVPFVILVIGLPVAVLVRGLVHALAWLIALA
jgi:hypothetical protein